MSVSYCSVMCFFLNAVYSYCLVVFVVSVHDGRLKVSTFYTDYDRSQGLTVLYLVLEISVSLNIYVNKPVFTNYLMWESCQYTLPLRTNKINQTLQLSRRFNLKNIYYH